MATEMIAGLGGGDPNDVETVVSDQGYGSNPFIETDAPRRPRKQAEGRAF